MQHLLSFLITSTFIIFVKSDKCSTSKNSHYGYYFNFPAYKKIPKETLGSCFLKCFADKNCSSTNYNILTEECEHIYETKKDLPQFWIKHLSSIHAEAREPAGSSCKRILDLNPKATSGVYWIRLGNGNTQTLPFQVYCDMETDGGGWTLVYSYRFTNFQNFQSLSNAITPFPSWPTDTNYVTSEISTKVPLNETSYSAMNFSLWKIIGRELLITPTISHWISCVPGSGDLVNWKGGSITCKVVKTIASKCFDIVPLRLDLYGPGPALAASSEHNIYIFFEGSSKVHWPVHDPCGLRSENNLKNVASPHGAIYIR